MGGKKRASRGVAREKEEGEREGRVERGEFEEPGDGIWRHP